MLFTWNADTIRWYTDAEAYCGFYRKLAKTLAPALNQYDTLCDVGCGPGLFDLAIAPLFETVDCVDVSQTALDAIRVRASELGLPNISTHLGDAFSISGTWDVIFMSFFGSRMPEPFLPLCRKLVIVVSKAGEASIFPGKPRHKRNTAEEMAQQLQAKRIPFQLTNQSLEFGQPFVSRADARRCVKTYVPDISDNDLDAFLTSSLTETADPVFPLYLPRQRSVGIFELDGSGD